MVESISVMEDFSGLINWENLFKKSNDFKKQKPFKFAFIEEFFVKDFYDKLYNTFPKLSEFEDGSDNSKSQLVKYWGDSGRGKPVGKEEDPRFSKEWNRLFRYAHTKEFSENFRKFSGVPVTNMKQFLFISYRKGGFQLPHIHNVGPSTLVLMFYFSKGWQKGDPGGTYMANGLDESKIIFEPYNLDNSLALFHDGPKAAHGTRYIVKDVERRALQITLEEYSEKTGWSGVYTDKSK